MHPFNLKTLALALCVGAGGSIAGADCTLRSTGNTPLPDLTGGLYLGLHPGGLYPAGSNELPRRHLRAAELAAASVQPLDRFGQPDSQSGQIVLASIGMSNSKLEFESFLEQAAEEPTRNPRVRLFNAAQGGAPAADWVDPFGEAWNDAVRFLERDGLSAEQVQVVWVKQAEQEPALLGAFPTHAQVHQAHLEFIARALLIRFPNVKLAFFSSRTRAYTDDPATTSPEPYAYESSFAVKWLIEKQIQGSLDLNASPRRGEVVAPVLLWGPYLWADGTSPRADGLVWLCGDTDRNDFTHPSPSGQRKVGSMLLDFFKDDPAATPWFIAGGGAIGND